MYEYKDIAALTRTVTMILWVYMVVDALEGLASFYTDVLIQAPEAAGRIGIVAIVEMAEIPIFLTTVIMVGRWIYRASTNAHALSDTLIITPGWAVAWYFVPIANLFKPFQAMKEIWLASHSRAGSHDEASPALLNWWWGLWIVGSALGNATFRLRDDAATSAWLGLLGAAVSIPLCLILVTLMKNIADAQRRSIQAEVFA